MVTLCLCVLCVVKYFIISHPLNVHYNMYTIKWIDKNRCIVGKGNRMN